MKSSGIIALASLAMIFSFGCTNTKEVEVDFLARLESIEGISVKELDRSANGRRRFEIEFEQALDHNTPEGPTFSQKVYLHHLNDESPVLFAPSGYSTDPDDELGGELISILQANLITSTHRYWPGSEPIGSDLQYLTIYQAASDHHNIVEKLKNVYKGPWVSAGVSKGGMTVLYHKRFYPEDVSATVAVAAPFKFGTADERYPQFLTTIGTSQQRQVVYDFQRMALERRATLVPLFESWFPQNGYTLVHDPDESFESAVIGYQPEFWEKYTVDDLSMVPSIDATDQEILDQLHLIENFVGYSELGIELGKPYYYQAFTEEGLEGNSTSHLSGLLLTDQIDIPALFNSVLGITPVYNPDVMINIYDWIVNSGNNIIFIYGGNDPWTAGSVELSGNTNAIKVVGPGANHSVFINDLPAADRDLVISTLHQWLNLSN